MLWLQPKMTKAVRQDVGLVYCDGTVWFIVVYLASTTTLMNWRAVLVTSDTRFFWVLVPLMAMFVYTGTTSTVVTDNGETLRPADGLNCRLSWIAFIISYVLALANIIVCNAVVHSHLPGGLLSPAALTMRLFTINNFVTAVGFLLSFVLNGVGFMDDVHIALFVMVADFSVFLVVVGIVLRNRARRFALVRRPI